MLLLAIVHMLFGSGYYTAVAKVPKRTASRRIGQVRWVKKERAPRQFVCDPLFVPIAGRWVRLRLESRSFIEARTNRAALLARMLSYGTVVIVFPKPWIEQM